MAIYKKRRPKVAKCSTDISDKAGEYRIISSENTIKYIGETCNLKRRYGEHKRTGKLSDEDKFFYQEADGRSSSYTRREHEREKITRHKPKINKSKGGEGRVSKR